MRKTEKYLEEIEGNLDYYDDFINTLNQLAFEKKQNDLLKFLKEQTKSPRDAWMITSALFDKNVSIEAIKIILNEGKYRKYISGTNIGFDKEEGVLATTMNNFINGNDYIRNDFYITTPQEQKEIYSEFIERIDIFIKNGADVNLKNNYDKKFFTHDMSIVSDFIPDFFKFMISKNTLINDDDFINFFKYQDISYNKKVPEYIPQLCDMFPDFEKAEALLYICFNIDVPNQNKLYYDIKNPPSKKYMEENGLTVADYNLQENPELIKYFVKRYDINLNKLYFDVFDKVRYPETVKLLLDLGAKPSNDLNHYPLFIKEEIVKKEKEILSSLINDRGNIKNIKTKRI